MGSDLEACGRAGDGESGRRESNPRSQLGKLTEPNTPNPGEPLCPGQRTARMRTNGPDRRRPRDIRGMKMARAGGPSGTVPLVAKRATDGPRSPPRLRCVQTRHFAASCLTPQKTSVTGLLPSESGCPSLNQGPLRPEQKIALTAALVRGLRLLNSPGRPAFSDKSIDPFGPVKSRHTPLVRAREDDPRCVCWDRVAI
jgi:hypothetical protein